MKQLRKWFYYKSMQKTLVTFTFILMAQFTFAQSLGDSFILKVGRGATLYKYSILYDVEVDSLKKWNNLKTDIIREFSDIKIINYNKVDSAQLVINKFKYQKEIVKHDIEINDQDYKSNLDLLNDRKANIDKDDPFAMQAFLELSKEKTILKDSFEVKKEKLTNKLNVLTNIIEDKEKTVNLNTKNSESKTELAHKKEADRFDKKKEDTPKTKLIEKEELNKIDDKKELSEKIKEDKKKKKLQKAIDKQQKMAYQNVEEGVSEVLVFDTYVEYTDTSSTKYKRQQAKLLKKLELELDTNKVDKNIMVTEVAVVREKKNKKYKIGDEVDYVRKDKSKFFLSRAMLEIDKYNFKKANEFINKSIELNPSYTQAYMLKGDMFASMKYYDKAIDSYEKALFLDDRIAQVYYNVGNCNIYLNKKDKAIESMGKAVAIDSTYVLAYLGRSSLYVDDKNYSAALADYNKILELNKFFYPALKGRGISLMNLGEYDKAIIDFNQFLEYDKSDVSLFYHRGLAKMYKSEIYAACLDFLTASEAGYMEADKAIKKYCD